MSTLDSITTHLSMDEQFKARVIRDREWDEFQVRFYLRGKFQPKMTYHTNELFDAQMTAARWVLESMTGHRPG